MSKKNFLEHKVKSKYIDCLLKQQKQWQWFIDAVEETFDFSYVNASSFDKILDNLYHYKKVYGYFTRITKIEGYSFETKNQILLELLELALYYNDKKSLNQLAFSTYSKTGKYLLMCIIIPKALGLDYLYDGRLFFKSNIYKLIDISKIKPYEEIINAIISSLNCSGFSKYEQMYQNNIKLIEVSFKEDILEPHRDKILSYDVFEFNHIKLEDFLPWEYYYLMDMMNISIDNRKLLPAFSMDGVVSPDFSLWTQDVLDMMNSFFGNNELAQFIIQTISYLLYKKTPSIQVIEKHLELFLAYFKNYKNMDKHLLECSSLKIISYMLEDKIIPSDLKGKYIKEFSIIENEIEDYDDLLTLKEFNLIFLKKNLIYQKIKNKFNAILKENDFVKLIDSINSRKEYFELIDDDCIEKIHGMFISYIDEVKNGVLISHAYLSYQNLLIALYNFNQQIIIIKNKIKKHLIIISDLWKKELYQKACESMHKWETSISYTNEKIRINNDKIINHLYQNLYCIMYLRDSDIISVCKSASESVVYYEATQIEISEDGPKNAKRDYSNVLYPIHKMVEYQNKYIEENRHLFLNQLDGLGNKYLFNNVIFKSIEERIEEMTLYILDVKNLYDFIRDNSDYNLIDFSSEITCAHIAQLFPLIELKIRDLAKLIDILPFNMRDGHFDEFRDPSSILSDIIELAYEETLNFDLVVDFLFIYYTLYSSKGLNYRNKFIHAQMNLNNKYNIRQVFVVCLLCLKALIERMNDLKLNKDE